MKQSNRLEEILNIIQKDVVETQGDLMNLLRERGFDVTQATVSRDIKRLNLHKSHDSNGHYRYVADSRKTSGGDNAIFHASVISVDFALNDVIIKCRSGMAQAVCSLIDHMSNELIVGTVAGDDTILIIARSENGARTLCEHFSTLISE